MKRFEIKNMKRINIFLSLLLILSLFILVKFGLLMQDYSALPSTFEGGGSYYLTYLVKTGHLMTNDMVYHLKQFGNFSAGLTESATHPLLNLTYAFLVLICGLNPGSWEFRITQSIMYALLMLSGAMLFIFGFKNNKNDLKIHYVMLLGLFALLATPTLIDQRGANGWFLILFSFYFLFAAKQNINSNVLAIIFLSCLPFFYFTSSTFILIYITVLGGYLFFLKNNKKNISNLIMFYLVLWLSYGIYISTSRYMGIVAVLGNFLDLVKFGSMDIHSGILAFPAEYLINTTLINKVILGINAAMIALIPLYYLIKRKNIIKNELLSKSILIALIVLPLWGFSTIIWQGSLGIPRLLEYGTLFAIIIICSAYTNLKNKQRQIFAVIAILAIIVSVFAYNVDENKPINWLTYGEKNAIEWSSNYIDPNDVIFTDHRIAGGLMSKERLRVTGITQEVFGVNKTIELANIIYYGDDANPIKNALMSINTPDKHKPKYLLFSNQMTQNIPGIKLYEIPLKHAPIDFMLKYDKSNSFIKIQDNGYAIIYEISD